MGLAEAKGGFPNSMSDNAPPENSGSGWLAAWRQDDWDGRLGRAPPAKARQARRSCESRVKGLASGTEKQNPWWNNRARMGRVAKF